MRGCPNCGSIELKSIQTVIVDYPLTIDDDFAWNYGLDGDGGPYWDTAEPIKFKDYCSEGDYPKDWAELDVVECRECEHKFPTEAAAVVVVNEEEDQSSD